MEILESSDFENNRFHYRMNGDDLIEKVFVSSQVIIVLTLGYFLRCTNPHSKSAFNPKLSASGTDKYQPR